MKCNKLNMSRSSQFSSGLALSSATSSGNGVSESIQDPQLLYQQHYVSPEISGVPVTNTEETVSESLPSPPVSHQESLESKKANSDGSSSLPEEGSVEEDHNETVTGNGSAKKGKQQKKKK
jgi:hypothetical protein